eukprot:5275819-Pyramimonas_sp.AAC.1
MGEKEYFVISLRLLRRAINGRLSSERLRRGLPAKVQGRKGGAAYPTAAWSAGGIVTAGET